MNPFRLLTSIAYSLKEHLKLGGRVSDAVGMQLIERFAKEASQIPEIKSALEEFGADTDDILLVFDTSVRALWPNPCVIAPPESLVAFLIFREPSIFRNILKSSDYPNRRSALDKKAWYDALIMWTEIRSAEIKEAHDKANGESTFRVQEGNGLPAPIVATGCLKASVVLFLAVSSLLGLAISAL